MSGSDDRPLFQLYWRTFLPAWLVPIPIAGGVLLSQRLSEAAAVRVIPWLVVGAFVYVLATQLRPLALWRRGEISYFEMWWLSTPIAAVALLCIIICSIALGVNHR